MWADPNRADAFEELYRRCHPELVVFCRRLLCGRGDPEAVAQEAFVRAWCSLDKFSGARPFWPWVATIARRLCIDHRRRMTREAMKSYVEASLSEGSIATPDELAEADEEHRAALEALKRLKPAEQRVITLRDLNGWSYDEIARFEGVTVESIRGSLKRARVALRESYARISAGAPAVAGLDALRRLRLRLGRTVERMAGPLWQSPLSAVLAGEAAVCALALVVGAAAVGVPGQGTDGSVMHAAPAAVDRPAMPPGEEAVWSTPAVAAPSGHAGSETTALPSGDGFSQGPPLMPVAPLPSDGGEAPEDVMFTEITPSPSYHSDSTLFATGTVRGGCPYATCPALFRSTDRGRTWARLAATTFGGGRVLLPPAFPRDQRIFAAGPSGLQVSPDGGQSFIRIAPIAGDAAISPAFSNHDPRILFGATPGWEYRDDLGTAVPGGIVLPSTSLAGRIAFAPNYPEDARIVVGGTTTSGLARTASAVFVCRAGACDATAVLPGYSGPASIALSPRYHVDGVVFAWRASGLFVSRDGGISFVPVALPGPGDVMDVAFATDGTVLVATRWTDGERTHGSLLRTGDLGSTWQEVGPRTALARGVTSIEVLPDGRWIVALEAAAGGGLVCSQDRGTTWVTRCT